MSTSSTAITISLSKIAHKEDWSIKFRWLTWNINQLLIALISPELRTRTWQLKSDSKEEFKKIKKIEALWLMPEKLKKLQWERLYSTAMKKLRRKEIAINSLLINALLTCSRSWNFYICPINKIFSRLLMSKDCITARCYKLWQRKCFQDART